MASEDTEALIDTLNIINAQQQMAAAGAATGNPRTKGVVVDSKSGSKARNVSPTLTTNEKSRYQNIFKILKDIIDPGPEAGKSTTTSRERKEANVSDAAKVAANGKVEQKQADNWLNKLLAGLGILAFAKKILDSLTKGLKSILKKMGSFIKKGLAAAFKSAKAILKGIGKSALKAIKSASKFAGKMFSKLANSKAVTALKGAFGAAFNRLKDVFNGVKNAVMKQASKLKNAIAPGAKAVASKAGSFLGGLLDKGKNLVSKGAQGIKYVGGQAVKGVKAVGGALLSKGKTAATVAMKGLTAGGKGVLGVLSKFAKLPIIGPVIEGFLIKGDLENLQEQFAAGEISQEELETKAGRRVMTGVTALGGSALGGIAGSLIPIPIIGTLAGAVAGDILGRMVGGVVADTLLNPYKRDVGKFALSRMNGTPMQDFIVQNGAIVPFSNKDQVLGMKTGGAIDQLISSQDGMGIEQAAVFNDMRELGKAQLQTLVAIKNGINALVAGAGSSPAMEVNLKPNTLTNEFYRTA